MSSTFTDRQKDVFAFVLAVAMAESSDPGDFRRRFVSYMDKAFGFDDNQMSPDQKDTALSVSHIYAKADNIYHKIK
ncbi:hypothetical protein VRB95_06375 [Erwinia aphidicola]|uniref:hypothetical protein n=1 Tax=Erwinia aphidicola TaxID=68334 RepID=UPI0006647B0C|nr:hypothetical protein [Erwinia aphidicola]KMV71653.1 hypothetical protein AI28_05865 [bacteria symbiont BFo1 of Frankliniella occidentalis]PIJ58739.1 hypothetical protein BOM23_08305 [Erwinia sp. OLMDLW33]KYP85551.1 hypothetical protein WB66_06550 [bacteria symbiont BFo1 of Frankliniella occidentalis]KYP91434.1 hypothetical protein WB91_05810 [bacteria symbiont BFo1 of Frankliniella occidentalis]CAH0198848.1 hypothetical protein SRABI13_01675 [Erwinia aphidicola]